MHVVCWYILAWIHGSESLVSCSPAEFFGGERAYLQDCSLQHVEHFYHPSLCSPSQWLASCLLQSLPGLNHSALLFSMPSGPVDLWLPRCWLPGCRVPWSPSSQPLISLLRVERVPRPLLLLCFPAAVLPSCLAVFVLGLIYWGLVPSWPPGAIVLGWGVRALLLRFHRISE